MKLYTVSVYGCDMCFGVFSDTKHMYDFLEKENLMDCCTISITELDNPILDDTGYPASGDLIDVPLENIEKEYEKIKYENA